jgi:hypothetical protein
MFKKLTSWRFFPLIVLTIIVLGFLWSRGVFNPRRPQDTVREVGEKAMSVLSGGGGFSVNKDTPGYENFKELRQGCPFKDCIPSIDQPQFETAPEADKWLNDNDVVFALDYKGVQRAYPQRILNWHEIVNDIVSRDPIAVTFCPLCGSAITFDRRVKLDSGGDQVLEFGVSGKLHNNDLVMYDRQSESLWQQITGEAIVGKFFTKKLKPIPMDTMRWGEWKILHTNTMVLSRNTGYARDYDRYPYDDYEQDTSTLFPVEGGIDATIHPKTVVFGVEVGNDAKAYPLEKLQKSKALKLQDMVGGVEIEISYSNGEVMMKRLDTGERLAPVRLFWFAWKAFHPETDLYK